MSPYSIMTRKSFMSLFYRYFPRYYSIIVQNFDIVLDNIHIVKNLFTWSNTNICKKKLYNIATYCSTNSRSQLCDGIALYDSTIYRYWPKIYCLIMYCLDKFPWNFWIMFHLFLKTKIPSYNLYQSSNAFTLIYNLNNCFTLVW